MKKFTRLAALLMAVCCALALFGCNKTNGGGADLPPIPDNPDIWASYDEQVEVKLVISEPNAVEWPGDATGDYGWDNNVWTQSWLEEFNIKTNVIWSANNPTGAYSQRLSLAIVSGDLPDLILTADYSQFIKLQEAGRLRAIDDYLEAYASDYVKKWVLEAPDAENRLDRGRGSDGKLYGLVAGGSDDRTREIFIRKDWMEQLNLSAPETMDDVINIGKTFVDRGLATYALPLYNEYQNGYGDIQAVANSVGAYPRLWFPKDGSLVYGSIQPEMKEAIGIYADLCAQGYIDKTFTTIDSATLAAQITRGMIGVMPSDYWIISYPLSSMWTDPEFVDWNVYPIKPMSTYKGEFKVQAGTSATTVACVNINYQHPEVMFKLINFASAKLGDPEMTDTDTFHSKTTETGESYQFFTMLPFNRYYNDPNTNYDTAKNVTAAVDAGFDTSKLVSPHDKAQYQSVRSWFYAEEAGDNKNVAAWSTYRMFYGPTSAFAVYNQYRDNGLLLKDALSGYQTETMLRQWSTLIAEEETMLAKIISGQEPLDYFDKFVTNWNNIGGSKVTEEVNAWYTNKMGS